MLKCFERGLCFGKLVAFARNVKALEIIKSGIRDCTLTTRFDRPAKKFQALSIQHFILVGKCTY